MKLFLSILLSAVSIYTISINDINGNTINFSEFAGKKILIVNTSSNSIYTAQYEKLEQLYQLYKDSLVIIAFPSNDFGHEPDSNNVIQDFVHSTYNTHFILAEKTIVSGPDKSALYNWIADINLNGMMVGNVSKDFTKFLIDKDGKLIGRFAPALDPMDSIVQNAIITNE